MCRMWYVQKLGLSGEPPYPLPFPMSWNINVIQLQLDPRSGWGQEMERNMSPQVTAGIRATQRNKLLFL